MRFARLRIDPNSLFAKSHVFGQRIDWQERTDRANIALLELWHSLEFLQSFKKCKPVHTRLLHPLVGVCPDPLLMYPSSSPNSGFQWNLDVNLQHRDLVITV
ncbi:hypothetical protein NZA98_25280, partial [Escherichia coli]|nr:hypothetical protein [Escherichia coli]